MKRLILIAISALAAVSPIGADAINKTTLTYAVIPDGETADTLRLDLYSPDNSDSGRPAVIFAFGGSFRSGARDAEDYLPYFNFLAENGYVVASIDYRTGMSNYQASDGLEAFASSLSRSVVMAVTDLYTATSYLLANSEELGIDPKRIVASGSSAGAITALQAEYLIANRSPLAPHGFNYAGVVTFAGAVLSQDRRPAWPATTCPMMMFHGDADTIVPYGALEMDGMGMYGSSFIASELTLLAIPHYLYSILGASHEVATSPMHDNLYDILAFLHEFVDNQANRITESRQSTPGAPTNYKTDFTLTDYLRANMPQ